MAYLGPNKFGEEVHGDAAGGRTVKENGAVLGTLSCATGFDPFNSVEHRYKTALEMVECVCREHDHDISGIGAVAAVREMAKHWDSHLREGAPASIVVNDLVEVKARIDLILQDLRKTLVVPA